MNILDNEKCILSSIFIDEDVLDNVMLYIEPSDFTYVYNQMIFAHMINNKKNNIANDYITISTCMKEVQEIDVIEYLIDITNLLPTSENIDSYIKIQKEHTNLKAIYSMFDKIKNTEMNTDEALECIEATVNKLTHINNEDIKQVKDYIGSYVDTVADGKKDDGTIESLYTILDSKLKIKRSNLIVIGARPGIGKTAYSFNLARNFAKQGLKTLFVSLEMKQEELFDRLLSVETGISHEKINERVLDSKEKRMLYAAKKKIESYDMSIHDTGITVENLINLSHRLKLSGKLDVLLIDYVGLLDTNKKTTNDNEKISYISRKLKQLAMKINIPIILLTQLNRNMIDPHSGKVREPNLSDIRSSGALEQDANVVMFLHQEKDTEYEEKFVDLIISKNRSGKTGKIHLTFLSSIMKFIEKEYDGTNYVDVKEKNIESIFEK